MNQQIDTDLLTGLYNHRFFAEVLSREAARADRYQHPLTMLLLDVDRMKQMNDKARPPRGRQRAEVSGRYSPLIGQTFRLRV
jgi:diguanylate cyclase (GGDEF)-like protein